MLQRNNVGSKREEREEFLSLGARSRLIPRTRSQNAADVSLGGYASSCDGLFIRYGSVGVVHERERAANVRFRVRRINRRFHGSTERKNATTETNDKLFNWRCRRGLGG